MKTAIQIAKIRAVVLYIMQSFTQGVDYIKLFKILYFAQQDHLVKYGKVIVEDSFRALKHGPVPAYTYKALQIAEGKPLDGNFDEFLSYKKYRTKKNAMREGEDVEQTKEFAEYVAACSKIFRIIDKLKLSKDASIAVFENLYRVANNKLN